MTKFLKENLKKALKVLYLSHALYNYSRKYELRVILTTNDLSTKPQNG